MQRQYDVYGVGNALVDTEVKVQDQFLASHALRKGMMTLVSAEEQQALLAALVDHQQVAAAGGSAANTMVGIALFGGTTFYTGKVGKDMLGALYRRSMSEVGVEFDVVLAYSYSAAVNFTARLGFLTGSDVLEGGGESAPVPMNDPDDSAMIVTLGTDFSF